MATSINYNSLLDVSQTIRYNWPASNGVDANGNAIQGFQFAAIFTDIKTQGSDGTVRDTQTITPVGGFQVTAFTPQQIFTIVNGSTAGQLLATELKNDYTKAVGTTVA